MHWNKGVAYGCGISIGEGAVWVLVWLGLMLLYTFLDVAVWRKIAPRYAKLLHLISVVLCMGCFWMLLQAKDGFQLDLSHGVSPPGILLGVLCAGVLYCLLDRCLDPLFERMLPGSEERYQETLQSLREAPVLSFLQVCVLAPIIEEILMRGFLLGGLSVRSGNAAAPLLSSAVFALLCGIVLGLLYLGTGSILCCITSHAGYNAISFFTMILPRHKAP